MERRRAAPGGSPKVDSVGNPPTIGPVGTLMRSRRPSDNVWDPADRPFIIGGVVAVDRRCSVAFSLMLGLAALDVWSGIIVFLVIVSAAVPVLRWVARAEGDPWLFKVMYGGLIAKLLSSLVRYFLIFVVYGGNGDAGVYHEAGHDLRPTVRGRACRSTRCR